MNHLVLQSKTGIVPCRLPSAPPYDLPPSAVTATITRGTTSVMAETAQTVVSWATSASAAQGASSIAVSSWGSSRVPQPGDRLLLAAATSPAQSPREVVVVESVASLTVTLREELERAWASGTKVYPLTQWVTLTSTHTATLARRYRVRLAITLTGLPTAEATIYTDELFDVVLHVPRNPLTLAAARDRDPNLFADLAGYAARAEGGFRAQLAAAFERTLDDVWQRGLPVDLLLADTQLADVTYWTLAEMSPATPAGWSAPEWAAHVEKRRDTALRALLARLEWVDEDQDLDNEPHEESQRRLDWVLGQ